ncbi:hypothetical protein GF354_02360 [Candidatus Peregrinibacteria bacterium]|nr:hypothetical protein [Candidatus Peregrinibacteria bacterium]
MPISNITVVDFRAREVLAQEEDHESDSESREHLSYLADKTASKVASVTMNEDRESNEVQVDPHFFTGNLHSVDRSLITKHLQEIGYEDEGEPIDELVDGAYWYGRLLIAKENYLGAYEYFSAISQFHPEALYYEGFTGFILDFDSVEEMLNTFVKMIHSLILRINEFDKNSYKHDFNTFKSRFDSAIKQELFDCPVDLSIPISRKDLYEKLVKLFYYYSPRPQAV